MSAGETPELHLIFPSLQPGIINGRAEHGIWLVAHGWVTSGIMCHAPFVSRYSAESLVNFRFSAILLSLVVYA